MPDPLAQITKLAGNLSPQLEAFLAVELEKLTFDVLAFQSMINKEVAIMSAGGLGAKGIAGAIKADLTNNGRVFSTFKNNVKSGVVGSNTGASRLGQNQIYDKTGKQDRWLWVAVGGHKVCMDCDARAGQVNSYSYWETNGVPSSGWSVCKGFCYCVLDPVGNMDQKVQAPTAREYGAKAPKVKPQPKWKPSMTRAEAKRWAKDSNFQGKFYHGTTSDGVAGIRKSGWNMGKSRTGQMYGKGAYGTRSAGDIATAFAGEGGKVMEIAFNVRKTLMLTDDEWRMLVSGLTPYQEGKLSYV